MPGTRSHRSRGKPSLLKRSSTRGSSNNETREIIQLARAALVFSLKRLTRQDLADKGSTSQQKLRSRSAHGDSQPHKRDRGTTTKARDSSRASYRSERDRDGSRDGNDLHDVMGQLAVGILGFGIRHFLHQRKKKEKEEKNKIKPPLYATTAATQGPPRRPSGEYPYTSYADYLAATSNHAGAGPRSRSLPTDGQEPAAINLATTLESLKKELRATSEALADLVNKPPSQNKKYNVHEALAKRAEGVRVSIDNLEMAINNVRNLHPEIDEVRGVDGGVGEVDDGEGKVRGGKDQKGKGKEGEIRKEQGDEDGWGEKDGRSRARERERVRRDRDGKRCSRDRESKPRRSVEFEDDLDRYEYSRGSERRDYRRWRR
ncbi:hypothetical protein QR685DRAFT_518318 [Neurospora intermedia]|uniref:Peroxin-14 n=1 Tax=Neurospora intermedia TaxID=5142 RepID=A0ABR3DNU0_NEUIN